MFLVWSGKGGLVPVFNVAGFFLYAASVVVFDAKHLTGTTDMLARAGSAALIGGATILLIHREARSAAASPPHVLRHRKTGQRIVRRKTAGSFLGLPTRYWVMISAALWTMVALAGVAGAGAR